MYNIQGERKRERETHACRHPYRAGSFLFLNRTHVSYWIDYPCTIYDITCVLYNITA